MSQGEGRCTPWRAKILKPSECRKFKKFDERHRGGSWILKPAERKKLLKDKGGSLGIETKLRCMQKVVERPEGKS